MTDRRSTGPARSRGPARIVGAPEIGFYRMKLVKDGPLMAARIWRPCSCTVTGGDAQLEHPWQEACDRFPRLVGEIDGRRVDPDRIWESKSEPIDEAEFKFLRDDAKWCRENAPAEPRANPDQPIDLLSAPIPF